jgi:hypothetical protein
MPIRPFLNGEKFDGETTRVLGVAFELACIALRVGDCADDVKQAIANKIISLAKAGERQPGCPLRTSAEGYSQAAGYFKRRVMPFPPHAAYSRRQLLEHGRHGTRGVSVRVFTVMTASRL